MNFPTGRHPGEFFHVQEEELKIIRNEMVYYYKNVNTTSRINTYGRGKILFLPLFHVRLSVSFFLLIGDLNDGNNPSVTNTSPPSVGSQQVCSTTKSSSETEQHQVVASDRLAGDRLADDKNSPIPFTGDIQEDTPVVLDSTVEPLKYPPGSAVEPIPQHSNGASKTISDTNEEESSSSLSSLSSHKRSSPPHSHELPSKKTKISHV